MERLILQDDEGKRGHYRTEAVRLDQGVMFLQAQRPVLDLNDHRALWLTEEQMDALTRWWRTVAR